MALLGQQSGQGCRSRTTCQRAEIQPRLRAGGHRIRATATADSSEEARSGASAARSTLASVRSHALVEHLCARPRLVVQAQSQVEPIGRPGRGDRFGRPRRTAVGVLRPRAEAAQCPGIRFANEHSHVTCSAPRQPRSERRRGAWWADDKNCSPLAHQERYASPDGSRTRQAGHRPRRPHRKRYPEAIQQYSTAAEAGNVAAELSPPPRSRVCPRDPRQFRPPGQPSPPTWPGQGLATLREPLCAIGPRLNGCRTSSSAQSRFSR
jgi:hypothetical protein